MSWSVLVLCMFVCKYPSSLRLTTLGHSRTQVEIRRSGTHRGCYMRDLDTQLHKVCVNKNLCEGVIYVCTYLYVCMCECKRLCDVSSPCMSCVCDNFTNAAIKPLEPSVAHTRRWVGGGRTGPFQVTVRGARTIGHGTRTPSPSGLTHALGRIVVRPITCTIPITIACVCKKNMLHCVCVFWYE